jgi:hypothetical protein
MNQAADAEFTGVPGKESRVRQTHPEGPAMLLDRPWRRSAADADLASRRCCCGSMAAVICASKRGVAAHGNSRSRLTWGDGSTAICASKRR